MKVAVYWHDIYLPYSDYLIRGFAENPQIGELCIIGPSQYEADSIYFDLKKTEDFPAKVCFKKINTYFFRKKWGPITEFKRCIQSFNPDCIIVLDEAFSINVLNAGIANFLTKNKATILFYGFENIKQTPPFEFLVSNFSLTNIGVFLRKTFRYLLIDVLLQPIRSRLVDGGLVCYCESADVVYQFGWAPKIQFSWWGLDLKPFWALSAAIPLQFDPKDHRTYKSQKTIGYVGRFVAEKGVMDLLDALTVLGDQYSLVLVGGGPLEAKLKQRIQELSLHNRVKLVPPKSRTELASLYVSFDLLVLPSRTDYFWKEQYGRVLVEAMACGIPVVGSRSGSIPVVIDDASRCFTEGDIEQMAKTIEVTINSFYSGNFTEKRDELIERSKLGYTDHFVDGFIQLHQKLTLSLGKKGNSP